MLDLNPRPHGPELCDISFRNGRNDRFLFEFVGRRHGGVVIRPDLFAELLHELLQKWLGAEPAPPLPPYRRRRARVEQARVFGVAAYLGFPEAANGFEDRASIIHDRPSTSAGVRSLTYTIRQCPGASAAIHHVGCQIGCHQLEHGSTCAAAMPAPDCLLIQGASLQSVALAQMCSENAGSATSSALTAPDINTKQQRE
jgi:hypothetical protein